MNFFKIVHFKMKNSVSYNNKERKLKRGYEHRCRNNIKSHWNMIVNKRATYKTSFYLIEKEFISEGRSQVNLHRSNRPTCPSRLTNFSKQKNNLIIIVRMFRCNQREQTVRVIRFVFPRFVRIRRRDKDYN